ncbi:DUF421 domain-containing protein [Selenomonadales bacterium OttesenSCG-928-I06]|nr:DUF421 domain-containing protein [Selenomonadales bacterium OttesenSCG-928-I06]
MEFITTTLIKVFITVMTLMAIVLFTGYRRLGDLTPFDFVISVTMGAVAGSLIIEPNVGISNALIAIFTLGFLKMLISWLSIKSRFLNNQMNFKPIVVIENGLIIKKNLAKVRLPLESLLQMLREKGIFDVTCVELAVLESMGNLSVLKKAEHQAITPQDLNVISLPNTILTPVIFEGKLRENALQKLGFSQEEIAEFKEKNKEKLKEIFIAFLDQNNKFHIINEDIEEQGLFWK